MSAMSPAPHNFRATEKYLRVCTTGCLVCTCTSIFVWKKVPGNGGQSGLARVENSPCNSESLATCSTRESSPVFRNYRNTMTDHISHFFPCCVNLGSSLFSNCLWEDKGWKLNSWDRLGLGSAHWPGTPCQSVTHRSRRALLRRSISDL